uniref:Chloroplast light harvesting complex protein n=1 Tax=Kryptoperidinium triquetrum TaxID=66468 RepID=Q5ENN1_KRYTR|nr:chloroplast light harvesting complex protein [Heterocapsa triquetra]
MGKSSVAACALAGAGACCFSSSAFTVGQQVASRPAAPQQFLGQAATQASQGESGASFCAAVGAVVGVASAAAAVGRKRVARKAGEIKVADGAEFAGGLIGSKYAGFGEYAWDPAGFSTRYPEHLAWYRESELKHGRVAMLAFVGLVVPDFVRIPLEQFEDSGLDMVTAHNKLIGPGLGEGPMWWLLCVCGAIESLRFKEMGFGFEKLTLENAGDLNFGKSFLPQTAEGKELMKTKELKNGRLAMMAVSGIFTAGVTWNAHHFPWLPGQ